jgi:hypothetical protein
MIYGDFIVSFYKLWCYFAVLPDYILAFAPKSTTYSFYILIPSHKLTFPTHEILVPV